MSCNDSCVNRGVLSYHQWPVSVWSWLRHVMLGGLREPNARRRAALLHSGYIVPPASVQVPAWVDLEARRAKHQQPALQRAAEQYWQMITAPDAAAAALPREKYVQLHLAMQRALVPAKWDDENAAEVAMEDWRFDAGADSVPSLSKAQFFMSLFELADTCARCFFASIRPHDARNRRRASARDQSPIPTADPPSSTSLHGLFIL